MASRGINLKGINLNDYDMSAIDKKFERMDKETIKAMKGTGSDLGKSKAKKKAATSTTKKKVKRK